MTGRIDGERERKMWVRERDVLISGSLKNGSSRPSEGEREVGFVFASLLPSKFGWGKSGACVHPGSDLVKFADTAAAGSSGIHCEDN